MCGLAVIQRFLVGKSRKNTIVQFADVLQLRKSLSPRIKEKVKSGRDDFKKKLAELMAKLKLEAKADFDKVATRAMSTASASGSSKKRPSKDDEKASRVSSSKTKAAKAKKPPDEDSTEDGEAESMEADEDDNETLALGEQEEDDGEEGDTDLEKKLQEKPASSDDGGDSDIFSGPFSKGQVTDKTPSKVASQKPAVSPQPLANIKTECPAIADGISDELQEMLAGVMEQCFTRDSATWLRIV